MQRYDTEVFGCEVGELLDLAEAIHHSTRESSYRSANDGVHFGAPPFVERELVELVGSPYRVSRVG